MDAHFWETFEKLAKGFRFGGYAMDLFKASKKPAQTAVKAVTPPAQAVSRAATAATTAAKATAPGTFDAVTKRPAKYINL